MRLPTILDLIYIKASRIRQIEETGVQMVSDKPHDEWLGIINYAIVGIMLLKGLINVFTSEEVLKQYDVVSSNAFELFKRKNHDYGGAWQNMSVSSFTDIVLSRILRMKNILQADIPQQEKTAIIESNLLDIINYGVFAIIRIRE